MNKLKIIEISGWILSVALLILGLISLFAFRHSFAPSFPGEVMVYPRRHMSLFSTIAMIVAGSLFTTISSISLFSRIKQR